MTEARDAAVLVSACLLGRACRFDGGHKRDDQLLAELEGFPVVPVCPEELGDLGTPRPAATLEGSVTDVLAGTARVITRAEGVDVSEAFQSGATRTLALAREHDARRAILKEGSPSCGCATTNVRGLRVPGRGVTAEWLARHGIAVEGRG